MEENTYAFDDDDDDGRSQCTNKFHAHIITGQYYLHLHAFNFHHTLGRVFFL